MHTHIFYHQNPLRITRPPRASGSVAVDGQPTARSGVRATMRAHPPRAKVAPARGAARRRAARPASVRRHAHGIAAAFIRVELDLVDCRSPGHRAGVRNLDVDREAGARRARERERKEYWGSALAGDTLRGDGRSIWFVA